jgi:hypothetical protein
MSGGRQTLGINCTNKQSVRNSRQQVPQKYSNSVKVALSLQDE